MKKTAIIIFVILIIAIIGVILYKKYKKDKDEKDDATIADLTGGATKASTTISNAGTSSAYDSLPIGGFPIKSGSKNKLTWLLQSALNKLKSSGLTVDGDFGPATKAALKAAYGVEQVDSTLATKIYAALYAKAASDKSLDALSAKMKPLFS